MVAIVVKINNKTTDKPLAVLLGQGLNVEPSGKCFFDIEILHTEFVLHPYNVNNKFQKRLYMYNLFRVLQGSYLNIMLSPYFFVSVE